MPVGVLFVEEFVHSSTLPMEPLVVRFDVLLGVAVDVRVDEVDLVLLRVPAVWCACGLPLPPLFAVCMVCSFDDAREDARTDARDATLPFEFFVARVVFFSFFGLAALFCFFGVEASAGFAFENCFELRTDGRLSLALDRLRTDVCLRRVLCVLSLFGVSAHIQGAFRCSARTKRCV